MAWSDITFPGSSLLTSTKMNQVVSNLNEIKSTNLLTSQTINSSVDNNDPVYYNTAIGEWTKSFLGATTPQGFYKGDNEIVLNGFASNISSIGAGRFYWLANSGGLVWDINSSDSKVKVGFSKTSSEFYVDIDTQAGSVSIWKSPLGFFGGGQNGPRSNVIDYIDIILAISNASDKGDLTAARQNLAAVNGLTYGFFGGGDEVSADNNVIEYIGVTVPINNAIDKGDLSKYRDSLAGNNGTTLGFFAGGIGSNSSPNSAVDIIDYIDITITTGNALDKGDLTVPRHTFAANNGTTLGFFAGGNGTSPQPILNIIDYIDITITTGNALDKGDLTEFRARLAGNNGTTLGFFAGGINSGPSATAVNNIDYIDATTTTGNALDKGDLTVARSRLSANNGTTLGFFAGGLSSGSIISDIIDSIDITTTTGNATDKGDLTVARQSLAGCSGVS